MSTQDKTVAEIATTLTDKPTPTAIEILVALHKAYAAGYAQGVVKGSTHTAEVMDRVMLRMSAP